MRKLAIYLSFTISVMITVNIKAGTYSGGTGEPNDPYRIATPNDLNDIGNHPEDFNKCFMLINDINMAGYSYSTAVIAPGTTPRFTGVFDGNDHAILSLNISGSGSNLGVFGQIGTGGIVTNLGVEDVNINGNDNLGGLCGYNYNGTIENCHATGLITGDDFIGGLCGRAYRGTIDNCYTTVSITGDDCLGGLCGFNDEGPVSNCHANGSVIGGENRLGGLLGGNEQGQISNCYATGSVTGPVDSLSLGGLCGFGDSGDFINCYATGSVTSGNSSMSLGGFCGSNSYGTISNCFATGTVDGGLGSEKLGGLCGNTYGVTVSDCYFLDTAGPDNGLGVPLTDTQMKQQASFIGWNFVDTWNIGENQTYPYLRMYPTGDLNHDDIVNFLDIAILAEHWLQGTEM